MKEPLRWVATWGLWTLPRTVLTYVLLVEGIALTVTSLARTPIHSVDLFHFGALAACVIAHVELTRAVEKVREVTAKAGPYMDTNSVWCVAAFILLPPLLASALVVVVYIWSWLRVWRRRRPLYRWVFSASTVIIATQVACALLAVGPGQHPGMPMTFAGLGLAAGAAALRWLINFSLVVGVLLLSSPKIRASTILQGLDQRILEVGAFGLGVIAAYLLTSYPVLLVGIVAGMAAMHRAMLVSQYRTAARTDAVTGLHSGSWWNQIGEQALERAIGTGSMLGVLILDVDHFKEVNDTYGHVAGDQVLCCVAQTIRAEIRGYDSPGRWGGDEFAIVLPEVTEPELEAIGERICKRANTMVIPVTSIDGPATVRNLTVSVGGALYSGTGNRTLGELVIAADTALYEAKNNGRGQVRLGPEHSTGGIAG